MRIGIVGRGDRASVLAEFWTASGHQVAVGDGRGASSGDDVDASTSERSMSAEEAARFGDIVVLAAELERSEDLPPPIAVAGKIVIDAMNAAPPEASEPDQAGRTSTEIIAAAYPAARVVKALNTLPPEVLRSEPRRSVPNHQRLALILSGDDARAKERVARLIEEIGFAPIDAGSLAHGGRMQEPGSRIHSVPMLPADARVAISLMG
jgi:8-hydroxy-5-deazaflavin:NADPH oxidoreductase